MKVLGFPAKDFEKILNNNHSVYNIYHKGFRLVLLKNNKTNQLTQLPCVNKMYSNSPDKLLKIANNGSKCYMTSKALGITDTYNNCVECHKQCLEKYSNNELFLIKK